MKTKKLRLISALLAVAMMVLLAPTAALAATKTTADGFEYEVTMDGEAYIIGYNGSATEVEIPSTLDGKTVTKIGSHDIIYTIWGNNQVTSVKIPSTVKTIEAGVFAGCTNLTTVDLSEAESLDSIGAYAFQDSGLTSVCIPANVAEISLGAFYGCKNLQTVDLSKAIDLKVIGVDAFSGIIGNEPSIAEITIPAGVTEIGRGAFGGCSQLTKVIFESPSKLNDVDEDAFKGCSNATIYYSDEAVKTALSGKVGSAKMVKCAKVTFDPNGGSEVKAKMVEKGQKADPPTNPTRSGWDFAGWYTKSADGKWADEKFDFSKAITDDMTLYARWTVDGKCGNNLTWILDSDGTLTISGTGKMADYASADKQPWANQKSSIKKVVIGEGVTSIGDSAFSGCTNLIDADMSKASSLTTIGNYAFSSCTALESVDLSKASSLTTIKTSFSSCTKLNNVVLNEGLKEIGGSAFNNCTKLKKIHIPSTVMAIGGYCFEKCSWLEEVTFADDSQLTTIAEKTFYWSGLKKITIPKKVKEIQYGAFFGRSGLKSVIFEPGSELTTVVGNAFSGCDNLTIYCSDEDENVKTALSNVVSPDKIKSLAPTVTFEVDGNVYKKQNAKENNFKAVKPENPTKKGYVLTDWCTKNADNEYKPFDFNTTVTEDITLYAQWEELPDHQLTVIGGTFAVKDETIKTETKDDAVIANIPVDAEVTVAFNKEAYADSNQTFGGWVIEGLDDAENYTHQETFTFTMPWNGVRIEAMTKVADVDDSGWDAATVVTGAVIGTGTAILAYHIGMEVYAEQVLGKDVAVPRTRGEVALLAWQLAGSPEPNAAVALLTDEAKAQQWAVESGLMQLDAEGNFRAEKKLSKLKALRVLDAAKKQV